MERLPCHMTSGLLIYGGNICAFPHIRYKEALPHICNCSTLNFLINEENLKFFFISVALFSFADALVDYFYIHTDTAEPPQLESV
jgi:hypothetical protein